METKNRSSFLAGIPAWALALLTLVLAFPVLMLVTEVIAMAFGIPEDTGEWVFYALYILIIALGCFYTCRQDPRSIYYAPLLCNSMGIISAFSEETFWNSPLWIVICSGWVLSVTASWIGAQKGRKRLSQGKRPAAS